MQHFPVFSMLICEGGGGGGGQDKQNKIRYLSNTICVHWYGCNTIINSNWMPDLLGEKDELENTVPRCTFFDPAKMFSWVSMLLPNYNRRMRNWYNTKKLQARLTTYILFMIREGSASFIIYMKTVKRFCEVIIRWFLTLENCFKIFLVRKGSSSWLSEKHFFYANLMTRMTFQSADPVLLTLQIILLQSP